MAAEVVAMKTSPAISIEQGESMRHYRLSCEHGVSSASVLPGRRALKDQAVVDILFFARHRRENGCDCKEPVVTTSTGWSGMIGPALRADDRHSPSLEAQP